MFSCIVDDILMKFFRDLGLWFSFRPSFYMEAHWGPEGTFVENNEICKRNIRIFPVLTVEVDACPLCYLYRPVFTV